LSLSKNPPRHLVIPQPVPKLVPLKHGRLYCERCRSQTGAGELVGWWKVRNGRRVLPTIYCAVCHRENVKTFQAK
jgi:hypothetical protein